MNAKERWIESAQKLTGITNDEARKLYRLYRDAEVLKINSHSGSCTLVHGAWLDADRVRYVLDNN